MMNEPDRSRNNHGRTARSDPFRRLVEQAYRVFERPAPRHVPGCACAFCADSGLSVTLAGRPARDWNEADVTRWFARAWLGALIVLFLNTSAYAAEIFYGALRAVPKGDLEAADAYGLSGWGKFRRITFPTTMRLAWPAYTNEAIFLFHATALVFFSSFPAFQQKGDALYYANYFADRTFNPFIPYPIVAVYFILLTLVIIWVFGAINARLNRHLPAERRQSLRIRPQVIR